MTQQRLSAVSYGAVILSVIMALGGKALAGCPDRPNHLERSLLVNPSVMRALEDTLFPHHEDIHYFAVTALPAFSQEWAVVLTEPKGRIALAITTAKDGAVTRGQVSAETARSARKALEIMLRDTRPCSDPGAFPGNDGVIYEFSAFVRGRGLVRGQTWSPEASTRARALVDIGTILRRLAQGDVERRDALEKELRVLSSVLASHP